MNHQNLSHLYWHRGGTSASRVASWDGSVWLPLGSGMNYYVRALTVYDGHLIAGGRFSTAGGTSASHIASWDGSAWSPLGSGMNDYVHALTVHDGYLIAGGGFLFAGEKVAAYLARWTKDQENVPPTCSIDDISPNPAQEGQTVSFQGSSGDIDGTVVDWWWESDIDGRFGYAEDTSYAGLSAGEHTITFKVKDDEDEWSAPETSYLTVTSVPTVLLGPDSAPADSLHDLSPFSCNANIEFYGQAVAQQGVIDSALWVFSDGEAIMRVGPFDAEYNDTVSHQFTDLSCSQYAIFTAWDSYDLNASDTLWLDINLTGGPLQVNAVGATHDGNTDGDIIGTFVSGFITPNIFWASASLGSCQPDSVVFDLGGTIIAGSYNIDSTLWYADYADIGFLPPGDNSLIVTAYDCEGNSVADTVVVRMREIPTWYSGSWLSLIDHHDEATFVTNGGAAYYQMEVSIPEPPVNYGPYDFSIDPFFPDLSNHLRVWLGIEGRFYIEGYSDNFYCGGDLIAKILGKGVDTSIVAAQDAMVFGGPYNDLVGITIYDYEYRIPPTTLWDHEGTLMTFWVGVVPIEVKYSVGFGLQAQISFGAVVSIDVINPTYLYLSAGVEPWVELSVWASVLFGAAELGMTFTPTFGVEFPCTLYVYPDPGPAVHQCTYFVLYYELWASIGWGWWEGTLYEGYDYEFDYPEGCHWGKGMDRMLAFKAYRDSVGTRFPQVFETPDVAQDPLSNRRFIVWMQDKYPEDTALVDAEVHYAILVGDELRAVGTITDNDRWETNPKVGILSPDSVIAVWTQNEISEADWGSIDDISVVLSNQELYYSIWTTSDSSWSAPMRITNNSVPDGLASLATSNGRAFLAWVRDVDGDATTTTDWRVYHSWYDGGNWSTPDTVYDGAGGDFQPSVAIDETSNQAVVVWIHEADGDANTPADRELYYRYINQSTGLGDLGDDIPYELGPLYPSVDMMPGGTPVIAYTSRAVVYDSTAAEWDTVGVGLEDRLWCSYLQASNWQSLKVEGDSAEVIARRPVVRVLNDSMVTIAYRGFEVTGSSDFDGEIYSVTLNLNGSGRQAMEIVQHTADSAITWMPAFDVNSLGVGQLVYVSYDEPLPSDPMGNIEIDPTSYWIPGWVCGDIDGDGSSTIDIADLVYLVDYMFNGGPEPPVMEAADVDGSGGVIDIADLVYLVDYMFNGGPEPDCP